MKGRRIASALLILVGMGIALFPPVSSWHLQRMQNRILQVWLDAATGSEHSLILQKTAPLFDRGAVLRDGESRHKNGSRSFDRAYWIDHVEGILTIQKIDLQLPILKSATNYHLDFSICAVSNTGMMGGGGNYVLAGHNSRIYGRHFNRLHEMVIGDVIQVYNGETVFTYRTIKTFSVDASEIWVMEQTDECIITLITCDYRMEPTGRLVVRGILEDNGD